MCYILFPVPYRVFLSQFNFISALWVLEYCILQIRKLQTQMISKLFPCWVTRGLHLSYLQAMNSTESLLHLSWVWILLCRAESIHTASWSVRLKVEHLYKWPMDHLVRYSLSLCVSLRWQQWSKTSVKIQNFGRKSLKKKCLLNPIIYVLNDSNDVWNNISSSKSFWHIKKCFYFHTKYQEIQRHR